MSELTAAARRLRAAHHGQQPRVLLAELAATGVARISFGSSLHQRATEELAATARTLHAGL